MKEAKGKLKDIKQELVGRGALHQPRRDGHIASKPPFFHWWAAVAVWAEDDTPPAPASDPRLIVAVMLDEPRKGGYYGGVVAAPVFSETVQQTLRLMGVQPDMAVKPQVVTKAVEESF